MYAQNYCYYIIEVRKSGDTHTHIRTHTQHTHTHTHHTPDSVITMMGGLSSNIECTFVTRVEEGDRRARIKLQRTKNLQQRVGVICYTGVQSNFARANESADYIPRHRNQSSIVWFEANQEFAYCDIEVIDDDRAEFIERFFVKLDGETRGRAIVSDPSAVHCVVINNDRNDRKLYFSWEIRFGMHAIGGTHISALGGKCQSDSKARCTHMGLVQQFHSEICITGVT